MIADEAVEAAAKVLASHAYPISLDKPYEAAARAALEAAAPYLMAEAWDEGWQSDDGLESNPYWSAK